MNEAVNYNALETLQAMIDPKVDVVRLDVKNKWLCATLSNGTKFSILNA